MFIRHIIILFLTVGFSLFCKGQDSESGPGYQLILMNNPALSGSEGDGEIRLLYHNYYPGNNYNLHSVYFSYDSFVPSLHGGVGIYISDDYMGGIANEMKGGMSYSYFLQAGKDLFINAGLSASVFHRGLNFTGAILPDQIDPLGGVVYPTGDVLTNSGKTVFDIGAGFLFMTGKLTGGLSVSHLAEPELTENKSTEEKLRRKLLLHVTYDLDLSKSNNFMLRPLGYLVMQGGYVSGGAGTVFETNYLSINALLLNDNWNNLNMQTGFSIKTGGMSIYYNYRFNISSGNNMMPFSLLHQTGLAFSLNNVDKRKTIKTINFPKL
jgi:type IX secretion system PorP/SprF family membrane protein